MRTAEAEEIPPRKEWDRFYIRQEHDPGQRKDADTWFRHYNLYRCGNCGRTTRYVDISERSFCYDCQRWMRYYEGEDGKFYRVKFDHKKDDDAQVPHWYIY